MGIFLRDGLPCIATCDLDLKKAIGGFLLFLKVAPFPHASALALVTFCLYFLHAAERDFSNAKFIGGGLEGVLAAVFFLFFLLAEADARSRFRDYLRVRDFLLRNGWSRRFIKPVSRSRCQRDAIRLAAEKTGYGEDVVQFFRDLGYRWFHVIPDALLDDPRIFFTHQFVKSSFFVRHYDERPEAPRHWDHRGRG